jgi:prophage antirepressor-like protein
MNDLVNFTYEGRKIRTVIEDGEPWWVGKDTMEALGYERFDSHLFDKVPGEWKGTKPIRTPGGMQNMLCLSEQGLYFFLGRSDKEAALPFQKWIAGEVVPSIRKTGSYALPGIDPLEGISTARLHELRMRIHELRRDLEEERISVREFRRLALNLDTPDTPENPVRGALVFKTHDDFTEYAETHKKANPTVYSFAKTALKITGNPADFVMIRDLYRLYQENTNTWEAVSRQKFVRRIKELYPGLEYKQKKVDGKPELAFFGCVLGGKGGVSDSHP